MADVLPHPHDRLFRNVFSDSWEAAELLAPRLPEVISRAFDWSTLTLVDGAFLDENLRQSESDLLFRIEPARGHAPEHLYILLEHQSSPDRFMPFRMWHYCGHICRADFRNAPEAGLAKVLAVVFYQGPGRWPHSSAATKLFSDAERPWPQSRFGYEVLDETRRPPEQQAKAGLRGRVTLPLLSSVADPARREAELRRAADQAEPLYETYGRNGLRPFLRDLIATRTARDVG